MQGKDILVARSRDDFPWVGAGQPVCSPARESESRAAKPFEAFEDPIQRPASVGPPRAHLVQSVNEQGLRPPLGMMLKAAPDEPARRDENGIRIGTGFGLERRGLARTGIA